MHPDVIVGRCSERLKPSTKKKIALFCDVTEEAVISNEDAEDIYEVPLIFKREKLDEYLMRKLNLKAKESRKEWEEMVKRMKTLYEEVSIAIVGKYVDVRDAYLSIKEALKHGGIDAGCKVNVVWVDSEDLESVDEFTLDVDGILVPGGFGPRGAEGKIRAIRYARENGVPFLGICFGFQLAVIEFARNVVGLSDANSTELDENTPHPVIDILPEQRGIEEKGGTMRLGDIEVTVKPGTIAYKLYGSEKIVERHRHRYEVNPEYIEKIESKGLVFSAYSDGGRRMEIAELPDHPFFFATQFHPEFRSRPYRPSPPFVGFVRAALKYKREEEI